MPQKITPPVEVSHAFPPIAGTAAHTLILGTMPGQKSLAAGQYYAHPQNQFWRLMGDIYGAGPALPYEGRVALLKQNGVAVWDVVQSCVRRGSMDADIRDVTISDFHSFYREHTGVERVVFDSIKAEQLYIRHVLPTLALPLRYYRVPSPSPAYAKMPYAEKCAAWKRILQA